MPSVSEKQKHFMLMSESEHGRAELKLHGKTPAPVAVAKEFVAADKGSRPEPLNLKR